IKQHLFPVTLQNKPRPVIGVMPTAIRLHFKLRLSERRDSRQIFFSEHVLVEPLHEFGGGLIVHEPKADYEFFRPGVHEATRQSDQSLATHRLADTTLARTHDNEVNRQVQLVDVSQSQIPILQLTSFVHHRKNYAGEFRVLIIEYSVRGEVNGIELSEKRTRYGRPVRFESNGHPG